MSIDEMWQEEESLLFRRHCPLIASWWAERMKWIFAAHWKIISTSSTNDWHVCWSSPKEDWDKSPGRAVRRSSTSSLFQMWYKIIVCRLRRWRGSTDGPSHRTRQIIRQSGGYTRNSSAERKAPAKRAVPVMKMGDAFLWFDAIDGGSHWYSLVRCERVEKEKDCNWDGCWDRREYAKEWKCPDLFRQLR